MTRRIPARLRVDYGPVGQPIAPTRGETRDIGRGGLFLLTDTLARHGSSLEMMLFPPTPTGPTHALGRVAWIGHHDGAPGMGVQFLFRSPDAREQIERMLLSLEDQISRGAVPMAALPKPSTA